MITAERHPTVTSPAVPEVLRWLDLVALVLALPVVLMLGAPLLGYAAGAGGWIVARLVGVAVDRYAHGAANPRTGMLAAIAGLFLRLWIVTFAIVAAGRAGEREDGLTAVIVVAVAFTIYLATSLFLRPQPGRRPEGR